MSSDRVDKTRPQSLEEFMRRGKEIALFEDFKQTETELHAGFTAQTDFDSQRLEFRATQTDQALLKKLQDGLLSTLRSHDIAADLTIKAQTSGWDDIMHLYKQYIDDIDTDRAKENGLRRLLRNGEEFAGVSAGLARMIPDEKGLSVLKEGLGYVILVWQRYIRTRDKVVEIFAGVPIMISQFHSKWEIYRRDVRLQHAFDKFLSIIFDSLTKLVEILIPHIKGITSWTKRVFKRFTDQQAKEVGEIGSDVDKAGEEISHLLDQLSHERVADINKTTLASLRESQAIRKSTHSITTILMDIQDRLSRVEEQKNSQTTEPNAREQESLMMVPTQMVAAMQTGLYNIVCEKQYALYYHLLPPARPASRDLGYPPVITDKQELMMALNSENASADAEEDLKTVLRKNHSVKPKGLDRARSLMSSGQFKDFIAQEDPALILINGHCRSDGIGKTSPLSVWCASFVAALKQSPSVIVVHYFCGLHTRSGRDLSGPLGLAQSLAGQLLAHFSARDTSPIHFAKDTIDRVEKGDIVAVCGVIETLLLELCQSKVVFCVVDNVCEFERNTWENWQNDLTEIFKTLYSLVDRERSGSQISLKVLLTCADWSTHLAGKVKGAELISLCGEVMQSGHMAVHESARGDLLLAPRIPMPGYWTRSRQPSTDESTGNLALSVVDDQQLPQQESGREVGAEEDFEPRNL